MQDTEYHIVPVNYPVRPASPEEKTLSVYSAIFSCIQGILCLVELIYRADRPLYRGRQYHVVLYIYIYIYIYMCVCVYMYCVNSAMLFHV